MTSQRETIIAHITDILADVETVLREREHWYDQSNWPCLYIDEGEAEVIEDFTFDSWKSTLTILVLGRVKGEWTDLNTLIEDTRKMIDSTTNTYQPYTRFVETKVVADPSSNIKEFEMNIQVDYYTTRGSA